MCIQTWDVAHEHYNLMKHADDGRHAFRGTILRCVLPNGLSGEADPPKMGILFMLKVYIKGRDFTT